MSALADIRRHEGFRAKPYRDTEGNLTIGYGTLLEDGITKGEANALLRMRLRNIVDEIAKSERGATFGNLPDGVRDALKNMAYNLGAPRLLGFRKMWGALTVWDFETAADEALDSKWARQVGARATEIADVIRRGK